MSDVVEEKGKVLSFSLFKVEKGREKYVNAIHHITQSTQKIGL